MSIPCFRVDAFTDRMFGGNPAAVCPLDDWLPDTLMQSIAAENNLSETAFIVADGDDWHIRWFTPLAEVKLCGHATLASAWVVFNELRPARAAVTFQSKSGPLHVRRDGDLMVMDFPSRDGASAPAPDGLLPALGLEQGESFKAVDWMVVVESETVVAGLRPDMARLRSIDARGVIVTAPSDAGSDVDFVSRFFAPRVGVPEDPVTGSAHCMLFPYWSTRLGRDRLVGRQLSVRGGEVRGVLSKDTHGATRVGLSGSAVLFARGTLLI